MPSGSPEHPHHERIEDDRFRTAVGLLDAGRVEELRQHLRRYPELVRQRVEFPGEGYFRRPGLLAFVAENPVRRGSLPGNIVEVAKVILEAGAGADREAVNETLRLVSSGRVARESGVQVGLIDLLCDSGAEPGQAMAAALVHGEFTAVQALLRRGALLDLVAAAGLGLTEDARRLLAGAAGEDRHRALALAAQFGYTEIVRLLLEAGEDPRRFNPTGFHAHSTPLHQAAFSGHEQTVRLLVAGGADVHARDKIWDGTPADWARHAGRDQIARLLEG